MTTHTSWAIRCIYGLFLGSILLSQDVVAQVARPIANPQPNMVGARFGALGGSNPTIRDINGVMVNPAAIGSIDTMPLSMTTHAFLGGYFDYKNLNGSWPFEMMLPINEQNFPQRVYFGLSYGSVGASQIPETTSEDNRIFPIGTYGAGFDILQGSAATAFYDVLGTNELAIGFSGKVFRQYIKNQSRYSFGFDFGTIATYHYTHYLLNKIHLGASILNLFSTGMVWPDNQQEAFLPLQIFVGARADLLDDTLSAFVNNDARGISVGAEYLLQNDFTIRGSTNFTDVAIGLGLQFNNIAAGFLNEDYGLRFDYAYIAHGGVLASDPDNVFSMSILGTSRPNTPRILSPRLETLTQQTVFNVSGVGPKETSIRIYNNGTLTRTTSTDRFGNWHYPDLPLREGANLIHIAAYSIDKETSVDSEPVIIVSDTKVPSFDVTIAPVGLSLRFLVTTNEALSQLDSGLDGDALDFVKDPEANIWTATIPTPQDIKGGGVPPTKMRSLQLYGVDKAGNQTQVKNFPFFIALDFPTDKYVHYRESVRLIGKSSAMASKITLNGDPVFVDKEMNFSASRSLKPGKNLLKLVVKTAGDDIEYRLRVLRLITYPDLTRQVKERREIEFLSTLGVLEGDSDGKFYPEKAVDRRFITRMMVKILKLPTEKVTSDLFPDVKKTDPDAPYIQAAIQNGLVFAYPDGTFKPDRPLTLSEAMFLLSNARIIDETSVTDEDEFVKRRQLAQQAFVKSISVRTLMDRVYLPEWISL
ncbi:hypothetical protein EBR96_02240 [bacterium]|nr:hypothetical protein [bacterium]